MNNTFQLSTRVPLQSPVEYGCVDSTPENFSQTVIKSAGCLTQYALRDPLEDVYPNRSCNVMQQGDSYLHRIPSAYASGLYGPLVIHDNDSTTICGPTAINRAFKDVVKRFFESYKAVIRDSESNDPYSKMGSRISSFGDLKPGWDSYNAPSPSAEVLKQAKDFLSFLKGNSHLNCKVDPSVVGGIGFTFRKDKRSVYIEFRNTGNAHAAYSGGSNGPQVEKVDQNQAGFTKFLLQAEKHLNEQTVPAHRNES